MDDDSTMTASGCHSGLHRACVLYDGRCPECQAQVERLQRWDKRGRLEFVSLHDPEVARLCPDTPHEELIRQLHVVDPKGRLHRGAGAVRFLSRQLPRLWWTAPMLHVPLSLWLWQWLYHQVALSRYCACSVPPRRSSRLR